MKIRKINCPYCNIEMKYISTERIQLGRTGWIALPVSIYECPTCSKLEFFRYKK
ncbi:hypothetical protein SAMN02910353_01417 [Ruminococcus sp. YRD2003]|uniref:hypothetical protein n=1 Tax=Ruminococcus sp. YRD2003 TaxID=1452313 RepID=UPI0008CD9242|nr:hypothetical protein SAMN02910353_01417 [Ruminococcus flavefaciens]